MQKMEINEGKKKGAKIHPNYINPILFISKFQILFQTISFPLRLPQQPPGRQPNQGGHPAGVGRTKSMPTIDEKWVPLPEHGVLPVENRAKPSVLPLPTSCRSQSISMGAVECPGVLMAQGMEIWPIPLGVSCG
jgi:hypothetical protein